jgi:nucleoside-diphosphate-sugar epimerase
MDLTDLGETERVLREVKPDVVVQMTGGAAGDPAELTRVNLIPTINLIYAAARMEDPPGLFTTGSAAEYGDPGEERASETATPRPLSPYGWVKAVETATAIELGRLHELNLTVVRPFNPVTPLLPESTALGNFRKQLLQGMDRKRRIVCGRIDVVRDFVSGTFIGEVMGELVVRPPGGIVNICSGTGVRLDAVMLAAAEILDVELEFVEDEALSSLPAPDSIVGDPTRLHSIVRARPDSTPAALARELLAR